MLFVLLWSLQPVELFWFLMSRDLLLLWFGPLRDLSWCDVFNFIENRILTAAVWTVFIETWVFIEMSPANKDCLNKRSEFKWTLLKGSGVNSVNEESGFNREALFKHGLWTKSNKTTGLNEKTEFIQLIQIALLTVQSVTTHCPVTAVRMWVRLLLNLYNNDIWSMIVTAPECYNQRS